MLFAIVAGVVVGAFACLPLLAAYAYMSLEFPKAILFGLAMLGLSFTIMAVAVVADWRFGFFDLAPFGTTTGLAFSLFTVIGTVRYALRRD